MSTRNLSKAQLRIAQKALQEAIKKLGGPTKVAALFPPIKSQAVSQWEICPLNRAPLLSQESGVDIQRLAPDLFAPARSSRSMRAEAAA